MLALGRLSADMLGIGTSIGGAACTPGTGLTVVVAPGGIYSPQNVDNTAYGSLPADTTHQTIKQGSLVNAAVLSCPAPTTSGKSINYLIEGQFQEIDTNPVVVPYYNSANPLQPFQGPGNVGSSQNTLRQNVFAVQVKAGTAATTGTQTTPSVDSGWTGMYIVTVDFGETFLTTADIVVFTPSPFIGVTALNALSQALAATIYLPLYGQTPAESNASVTPTFTNYRPGDFRRYGGDGTGVADSTAAINTAVSIVQQCYVDSGLNFLTTGNHSPVAGCSIVGPGKVTLSGGTNYIFNVSNSNVLINRVSMNAAAASGANKGAVQITGASSGVEISDCPITSGRILENGTSTTNLKILRNTITGACVGSSVSGGAITIGSTAAVSNFEVAQNTVFSTDGTGIIAYNGCIDGIISRNRCNLNFGAGIIVTGGSLEITISANVCKFNGQGNSSGAVGIGHYQAGGNWAQRNTMTGNVCAFNNADGFDLVSSGSTAERTWLSCTGNVSENNGTNVSGYGGGGTGFNIQYNSSSTFTGNIALGNSSSGYRVFGGANVSFAANQSIANGSLNPGAYHGFDLQSATNCTFSANIANNLGGVAGQGYGIHEDGGCNGNVFSANNCTNNVTGTVLVQGPTSILRDDVGGYIDQVFTLGISNISGTLNHTIYAQSGQALIGNYSSRINNATASATPTPTGADSSTAMVGGAKIGSAGMNDFWFDTAAQTVVQADVMTSIVYNDTGNTVTCRPQIASININGVTQNRLMFQFYNGGTPFALNATNIPTGKSLEIQFKGRLN